MSSKNVNIGFDEELLQIIDDKAKEIGRSRSNYIRFMIGEYLDFEEKENKYKNKIAELEKELIEKNVILKSMPSQPNIVETEIKPNNEYKLPKTKLPNFNKIS